MIYTVLRLHCEECAAQFPEPILLAALPLRRDAELLRARAKEEGWKSLRPKGKDHYGDYCGNCASLITTKRRTK